MDPPRQHLLVVDDDREIRQLLSQYLQDSGYRVTAVADGRGLRAAVAAGLPDLVVLDVMLPGEDGVSLCRWLRGRSDVPVIMLTARGDETDRVVGLEVGADDYVPKPFSLRPAAARWFRFAGWQLDTVTRNLTAPDGVVVPLSATEFKLLRVLLDHPGRILNRDQLIELMLSRDAGPFDRALDVQVSRLRQRLREDAREPTLIKTVRGQNDAPAAPVAVRPPGAGAAVRLAAGTGHRAGHRAAGPQ
jgi:two-component system, OmpR family, response regulator